MRIRDYSLPPGWYPRDPDEIAGFLSDFAGGDAGPGERGKSRAAVSPHAGWFYSGRLAAKAVSSLNPEASAVVILGGHLPGGAKPLFAHEDAVQTPLGPLNIDARLRSVLQKELNGEEDRYRDNTVEVLLPMVKFFFPDAGILWLRLPADFSSFSAGKAIASAAAGLGMDVNVIASTDLTHYGVNYGFTSHGIGKSALKWVKEVNDFNFIRAVEEGRTEDVLRLAGDEKSSCSAGAVLGAMGFAEALGLGKARLLEYSTSADIQDGEETPDSFVGYAAFTFF